MTLPDDRYKWWILALVALTAIFTVSMPTMAMSVLSKEISNEFQLNVVQVGIIWGSGSFLSVVTSLLAGVAGDRFGARKTLIVCSLLLSLSGALRGLATSYATLLMAVLIVGALMPFVIINGIKILGQWFPREQLGLANGIFSTGMALGFMLGALLSASVFSPLLGGWHNVFLVYGLAGALFCIPWYFSRARAENQHSIGQKFSVKQNILHVIRIKNIWLLGLFLFCLAGSIQGLLGYLPLYLRNIGWQEIQADGALTLFHAMSLIFVIPIALWSDRLKSRKRLLMAATFIVMLGTGFLGFTSGAMIWLAVPFTGFVRDGSMAIFYAMVFEEEGVGPAYTGTAIGVVNAINGIGLLLEPPVGNSLAVYRPGAPFLFWAGSAAIALVILLLHKGKKKTSLNESLVTLAEA